ncbi:MAG: hypothetical protein KatS3mg023_4005 [Armatimonadota bacterium]|nr:MAG: hypothetical protein KatS3mg023_4005 [Armatimonadota bacterium]
MVREHLNERHDTFVDRVAIWCLRRGYTVQLTGQEVSSTPRYTPDMRVILPRVGWIWIEAKVTQHARVAIEVPELVYQLALPKPVVVVAQIGESDEVGFHLQTTTPSVVLIPDKAPSDLKSQAEELARRFQIPARFIRPNARYISSNLPFCLYTGGFSNWKRLLQG